MASISGLRLRHAHTIEFPLDNFLSADSAQSSFCIEGWVSFAPTDNMARLFLKPNYDGEPLRLKPGLYPKIAMQQFPATDAAQHEETVKLRSIDLPEGVEAVFFSEAHFRGTAFACRDDLPMLAGQQSDDQSLYMTVGSVLILDRRHREQSHVVLFENENYGGKAEVLQIPQSWAPDPQTLATVGSAWVPPGIALDITVGTDQATKPITVRGDLKSLTHIRNITARRATPLTTSEMVYSQKSTPQTEETSAGKYWPADPPDFSSVRIPATMALFLFSQEKARGTYEIILDGKDDFSDLSFAPKSAVLVDAPDGVEGIVYIRDGNTHVTKVSPPGSVLEDDGLSYLFIPPGYRLVPENGESTIGEVADNPTNSILVKNYRVERFIGLFSNNGNGLAVKRSTGALRAGSDELRFGGTLLQPERWYHLAYAFEESADQPGQGTVSYFVNGKKVQGIKIEQFKDKLKGLSSGRWIIGEHLRGTLAALRVWKEHRDVNRISTERYPQVAVSPYKQIFSDLNNLVSEPDAITLEVQLPDPPAQTRMVKQILQELEVQRAYELEVARQKAASVMALAEGRVAYKLSQAREQARQMVHLNAMKNIAFVRGKNIYVRDASKVSDENHLTLKVLPTDQDQYPLDISMFRDGSGDVYYFIADSWNDSIILSKIKDGDTWLAKYCAITPHNRLTGAVMWTPQAIVCDPSGAHADANGRKAIFWIEEDGSIYRYWDDGTAIDTTAMPQSYKLIDPLAAGRSRSWDMACFADSYKLLLIWCNGFEILEVDLTQVTGSNKVDRNNINFLVPHAVSPYPVAVAADPDGNLVWLDAAEERVRFLKRGETLPLDLYPAPNPARGLSVCRIPTGDPQNPITYVYWVSGLRRIVEVPVIDTPGRYIDLWQSSDQPVPHGQHVAVVAVDEEAEVAWDDHVDVFTFPLRFFADLSIDVPVNKAFRVTFKMKITDPGGEDYAQFFLLRGSYNIRAPEWLGGFFNFEPAFAVSSNEVSGSSNTTSPLELPKDQWFELQVEYQINEIIIRVDQQVKAKLGIGTQFFDECTTLTVCLFQRRIFNFTYVKREDPPKVMGQVAEVIITQTDTQKTVLHFSPAQGYGNYYLNIEPITTPWVPKSYKYQEALDKHLLGEPTTLEKPDTLAFQTTRKLVCFADDSDGRLKFEPMYLDMRKGWTIAADLVWDGSTSSNPVCVYELATFENEDRLVCAIEDGLPVLYIVWKGKQILGGRQQIRGGARVKPGVFQRLCWIYNPKGEVTTYIDGQLVTEAFVSWANEPTVWDHHSLGAANPNQLDTPIEHASIQDVRRSLIQFKSFDGKIARFGAWNSFEPNAANNWEQPLPPDPSWDRSLVTYESRHRYLQAGRLDGKEPPVTLFQLDMDGALNITSVLDSDQAAFTLAQAELNAAEAYAIKLKADALKKAKDNLGSEEAYLRTAQERATSDLAEATSRKLAAEEAARQERARAILALEEKKRLGIQQATRQREEGRSEAEAREIAASTEKERRIAEVARQKNEKERERNLKRDEAKKHGLV